MTTLYQALKAIIPDLDQFAVNADIEQLKETFKRRTQNADTILACRVFSWTGGGARKISKFSLMLNHYRADQDPQRSGQGALIVVHPQSQKLESVSWQNEDLHIDAAPELEQELDEITGNWLATLHRHGFLLSEKTGQHSTQPSTP